MTPEDLIAKGPLNDKQVADIATESKSSSIPDIVSGQTKTGLPDLESHIQEEEGAKDEGFNLGDFIKARDQTSIETKKETKKEVKKEILETSDDIPGTAKPIRKQVADVQEISKDEDYSDLPKPLVDNFGKMARVAREAVSAEYRRASKQIKELQEATKKNLSYRDHENGYLLDAGFQKALTSVGDFDREINYWTQQMENVELGNKWMDIVQTDKGFSQVERDSDVRAKVLLQNRINASIANKQRSIDQAQNIQSTYTNERSARLSEVKQIEDQFFPNYKDPAFLTTNPAAKKTMEVFSSKGEGGNLLAPFTAKLYAFVMDQISYIDELEGKLGLKEKSASDKLKTGPTSTDLASGRNALKTGTEDGFDIEAFERLKRNA